MYNLRTNFKFFGQNKTLNIISFDHSEQHSCAKLMKAVLLVSLWDKLLGFHKIS